MHTSIFNKKVFLFIFIVIFLSVLFTSTANAQDLQVVLLQDIGTGLDLSGCTVISSYFNRVFFLLIGAAGFLAVIMIIWGGFQYIGSSVSPSAKSDAKDKIQRALLGLFIVLASVLILRTINPVLVDFSFNPCNLGTGPSASGPSSSGPSSSGPSSSGPSASGPLSVAAQQAEDDGASPALVAYINSGDCISCSAVPSSLPQKVPTLGCLGPAACQISTSLGSSLVSANSSLTGVTWQITEMYPPTVVHLDPCHAAGSCVDVAIRNPSPSGGLPITADIQTAGTAFSSQGLTPEYEVQNQARADQLVADGFTGVILVVPTINAEHFSVYE